MDSSLKRAWRIISPIIIYLVIERIVGFTVNFYYIMGRLEEDAVWTQTLEEQLYQEVYEMLSKNTVLISGIVASIGILIFYRMFQKECKKRSFIIENIGSPYLKYIYVAAVAVGFTLAVNLAINAWGYFKYNFDIAELNQMIYSESIWKQVLVIGVIVPICEELLFRGVIYERIAQSGNARSAMILTSVLFAFFHGTWIQIIYAFFFSFLMIYAYQRCGSFAAPICFHIVSNISSLILRQFPPLSTIGYSIGIVLFAILGLIGIYMLKHQKYYQRLSKNHSNASEF